MYVSTIASLLMLKSYRPAITTMTPFKSLFLNLTTIFICLLLIPIIAWLVGWVWVPVQNYHFIDLVLFIITESGSAPYFAMITSLILSIWLSMRCKLLQHHWVIIFLSVFLLQGSTQILKSGIKTLWEEPRPYMSYVVDQGVELDSFYKLNRQSRGVVIETVLQDDVITPKWLLSHWQKETGFSFPSGHTIFAVMWAFIIVGFLTRERDPKTHVAMIVMTLWAGLMMISRLRLGMHFPIDLFTSTVIAYPIALFFFYFLAKRDTLVKGAFNQPAPKKQ